MVAEYFERQIHADPLYRDSAGGDKIEVQKFLQIRRQTSADPLMGKTPEIIYRKIGRYGNFSAKSVCRRFVKIEAINEHIGNREIYREANRSGNKKLHKA